LFTFARENEPGQFLFWAVASGLIPGALVGIAVSRGGTFSKRVWYGVFAAPIMLTLWDIFNFAYAATNLMHQQLTRDALNWQLIYFSLLSNVFGGAVGGMLIGTSVHLFAEHDRKRGKKTRANEVSQEQV
jgi:hypothetical protein